MPYCRSVFPAIVPFGAGFVRSGLSLSKRACSNRVHTWKSQMTVLFWAGPISHQSPTQQIFELPKQHGHGLCRATADSGTRRAPDRVKDTSCATANGALNSAEDWTGEVERAPGLRCLCCPIEVQCLGRLKTIFQTPHRQNK